jgi:SAM-dependent methyltransferase
MKHHAPATERNREPIREVLARELPASGTVLEIASGSGEHAVAFARAFPGVTWQPSDPDERALESIAAWRAEAALPNLAAPVRLDATATPWPVERADAIVCINMVHIAPWEAALALFAGAARLLAPGALLFLYGPYRFGGAFTAPSNQAFDASLRSRDPRWGVRDVDDLRAAAAAQGFTLGQPIALPANNHVLLFRRDGGV